MYTQCDDAGLNSKIDHNTFYVSLVLKKDDPTERRKKEKEDVNAVK